MKWCTPRTIPELLAVQELGVRFSGIVALDDLSFTIQEGEICALIGPNGAGKTTLCNVVSRLYEPTSGSLRFGGDDLLTVAPHRFFGPVKLDGTKDAYGVESLEFVKYSATKHAMERTGEKFDRQRKTGVYTP